MANITRDQFVEANAVSKKIFQEGSFVADADLNELGDILRIGNRRLLSCLVGHTNRRFGDGFKVTGTGASLAVTIEAGFAAFLIGTQQAVLLNLAEDATLSGFTTWSTSRTDYVYIDISEPEISAAEDPNIVNPDVGQETCRDLRLEYVFAISTGAVPGAAPTGHTYISIASITKTTGSNIAAGDVTVLISSDLALGDGSITTAMLADDAVTNDKIAADVAGDGLEQSYDGSLDVTGITDFAGAVLKMKQFTGTWDMDGNTSLSITHGLDATKIRSISIVIKGASSNYYPLDYDIGDGSYAAGSSVFNATVIALSRVTGGMFDVVGFSAATYHVTVIYEA